MNPFNRKAGTSDDEQMSSVLGSRKLLVVGGTAVAVVAVGAMAYVLTTGGDSTPLAGPIRTVPKTSATGTAGATASPTASAIKTYTAKDSRDPFQALVIEQAASTGAATTGSTAPASTSTGGATSATSVAPRPTVTKTVTKTIKVRSSTPAKTLDPTLVKMASVAADNSVATLTVNSKQYVVRAGDTFSTRFKMLSMDRGKCAAMQYGDTIFGLCEGETRSLS